MQAHADALPRPLDLAGKERSRRPLVRSGRRGDGEFGREIRRDAAVTYDPAGIVVVASGWLAFYVAAVIHLL
jgi:hypothetical protein